MQFPPLNKKLATITIGVLLIVILIATLTSKKPSQPLTTPNPSPPPTLKSPTNLLPLTVEQVFPPPGTTELGNTTNSITVFFDQPINAKSGKIISNPSHPITLTTRLQDPNMLIIQPQVAWGVNQTYTIILQAGLMSNNNQYTLKTPIELNYTMIEPELPHLTAPI